MSSQVDFMCHIESATVVSFCDKVESFSLLMILFVPGFVY